MTLAPEELDPNSELRRKARANVATFEPLTGEELAEISRLFAGTNVPAAVIGGRPGASGGPRTAGGVPPRPPRRDPSAPMSGPRRAHTGAGRDASLPKS